MYRRKGDPIWVAVQGRAVNPERPELGYIFAFVDIDKRKRSESELRSALSELQLIFDNSLVGMLYVANDLIVKANAATEQLFGYDVRDFSELQIGSLFAVAGAMGDGPRHGARLVRGRGRRHRRGRRRLLVRAPDAARGRNHVLVRRVRPAHRTVGARAGNDPDADGRRRAPPVRGGIAPRPELPRPGRRKPSGARVRPGGRVGTLREPQPRGRGDHGPHAQAGRRAAPGPRSTRGRSPTCTPNSTARRCRPAPRWSARAT